jgi:nitrogen-specific signal transduction histidine kinase
LKRRPTLRIPGNLPFLLKIYFIAGTGILVTGALLYNNSLMTRMKGQSENTTRLFSRFIGIALEDVSEESSQEFIREVRGAITLPFILTDRAGRPVVWSGIGIEMLADDEYSRVIDFDPDNPDDPLLEKIRRIAMELDSVNDPVSVESEMLALVIHYGPSKLSRELRVAPYVQLGVVIIFIVFGLLGMRAVKTGEQRLIWVGMAKETAHQLGTPLSSIMGWLAIIRDKAAEEGCSNALDGPVDEVSADVDRLSRISARFSKIGSAPPLEYQKISQIIEDTVDYFERRRPALKIDSTIEIDVEELPLIRCSAVLLGWVFENLMKNSLDAIAGEDGKINIRGRVDRGENDVVILFSDNGRGMSSSMKKKIFNAGYTTKSRGWGLGLALVKRIVEDIHGGSIKVAYTHPGGGSTFEITFPVD